MDQEIIAEVCRRIPGTPPGVFKNFTGPQWEKSLSKAATDSEDMLHKRLESMYQVFYSLPMTGYNDIDNFRQVNVMIYIVVIDRKIHQLEADRKALDAQKEHESDERAQKIGEEIAGKAIEKAADAFAKMLEDETRKREQLERELLEKEEERHRKEEEDNQKKLQEKDETIEEYKKALEASRSAIDLKQLIEDYMKLAQKNQNLIKLLNEKDDPVDPLLMQAATVGDIESAKTAVRLGANVNAQDTILDTPLHKACASNDKQMVAFLLANGCDATMKNAYGKLASELATNADIVKLVSDYQASMTKALSRLDDSKKAPSLWQSQNLTMFAKSNRGHNNQSAGNEDFSHHAKFSAK